MRKTIQCIHCGGTGTETIQVCDKCGTANHVGLFKGRDLCDICWGEELSDEEKANL